MLRSFRVENHKSFKDEAELLLMPTYDKTRPVLPATAIFGANAAGKSNLLDALRWMRDAVVSSFRAWEPNRGVPRVPFALNPPAERPPSAFVVEIVVDDVRYTYGFVVDSERVLEEWLYSYPQNRRRTIFSRVGAKWEFGSTVPRAKLEQATELTPSNGLFLTVAARAEVAEVNAVFRWFQQSLTFVDPSTPWRDIADVYLAGEHHDLLLDLVRVADLGILDIRVGRGVAHERVLSLLTTLHDLAAKTNGLEERINKAGPDDDATSELADVARQRYSLRDAIETAAQEIQQRRLVFVHGEHGAELTADEQSFGTVAWLRILVHALRVLETGSVLCVDEIDSSLHPRLTARLIELFRNPETNDRHAQLVFTTHDATLLGTSFGAEILGRDEIWFVEKGQDGSTRLYPLADFKPRKEENTERRYLGGSYGAVPAVFSDTLVDRYLASRRSRRDNAA